MIRCNYFLLFIMHSFSSVKIFIMACFQSFTVKSNIQSLLQAVSPAWFSFFFFNFFLERRREGERERNIKVGLPLEFPLLGTWPTTQACALTGNQTNNPLVCRLARAQSTEPYQPGCFSFLMYGSYFLFLCMPYNFFIGNRTF